MNRSTILLLGLAAWVLAACGSSTSMEEAHDDHDDDHDDDVGHHGHHADYMEDSDWMKMRMAFDTMPMPEAPENMSISVGTPVSARWSGEIDGTINPSHDEFSDPEIGLFLDNEATMHGEVTAQSSETGDREFLLHVDAYDVTGSTFASPDDDANRMTGTFYGEDHGTVVGTVNTAVVIGTYQAEHTDHGHDH